MPDETLDDMLDSGVQALNSLDRSTPVKVLGLRAEFTLVTPVVTVLGSLLIYSIQNVYRPT